MIAVLGIVPLRFEERIIVLMCLVNQGYVKQPSLLTLNLLHPKYGEITKNAVCRIFGFSSGKSPYKGQCVALSVVLLAILVVILILGCL